jgi:hypothetical protein
LSHVWRFDVLLPRGSEMLGMGRWMDGRAVKPELLVLVTNDMVLETRSFLIVAGSNIEAITATTEGRSRLVGAFPGRVGRLGGVGWISFSVYEVENVEPGTPQHVVDLQPVVATATTLEQIRWRRPARGDHGIEELG